MNDKTITQLMDLAALDHKLRELDRVQREFLRINELEKQIAAAAEVLEFQQKASILQDQIVRMAREAAQQREIIDAATKVGRSIPAVVDASQVNTLTQQIVDNWRKIEKSQVTESTRHVVEQLRRQMQIIDADSLKSLSEAIKSAQGRK